MASPAGPRPGWSRRAQYTLFFGFIATVAAVVPAMFIAGVLAGGVRVGAGLAHGSRRGPYQMTSANMAAW